MSETDSFIEEVTEEVRRDKLFGYIKRYGWIAILLVLLLVGGAAYNEWSKASARADAEARGDAILAAMEADDSGARAAALAGLEVTGGTAPVVAMLLSTEAGAAEDGEVAARALRSVADDAGQPVVYRDLAALKLVILTAADTAPADRIAALQPLAEAGSAFRVLAEEQMALAEIEQGDREAALKRLRALTEDTEASQGLRQRVSQLIVALGGYTDPA